MADIDRLHRSKVWQKAPEPSRCLCSFAAGIGCHSEPDGGDVTFRAPPRSVMQHLLQVPSCSERVYLRNYSSIGRGPR